jgi:hypothetical protein
MKYRGGGVIPGIRGSAEVSPTLEGDTLGFDRLPAGGRCWAPVAGLGRWVWLMPRSGGHPGGQETVRGRDAKWLTGEGAIQERRLGGLMAADGRASGRGHSGSPAFGVTEREVVQGAPWGVNLDPEAPADRDAATGGVFERAPERPFREEFPRHPTEDRERRPRSPGDVGGGEKRTASSWAGRGPSPPRTHLVCCELPPESKTYRCCTCQRRFELHTSAD